MTVDTNGGANFTVSWIALALAEAANLILGMWLHMSRISGRNAVKHQTVADPSTGLPFQQLVDRETYQPFCPKFTAACDFESLGERSDRRMINAASTSQMPSSAIRGGE